MVQKIENDRQLKLYLAIETSIGFVHLIGKFHIQEKEILLSSCYHLNSKYTLFLISYPQP